MADDASVYPPDFTTPLGIVRALIPDVDKVDFTGEGMPVYMFSDAHLNGLLALYSLRPSPSGRIKRAAADAIGAVANSEALISKVIKTEDLQTDGAKVANALLARAKQLLDEADKDDEQIEDEYAFAIVDFQPYPADCLPYSLRGFPQMCCMTSYTGSCGCSGSKDRGAGFGSGHV
jgi:hypothetical protein